MTGGRPDPFAFTKAIHKAQRNAIKQLIPVPVIREVLNFYLHRKAGSGNSRPQQQIPQGGGNIAQAQKATFAIARRISRTLLRKKVSRKRNLWNYMKRKCGVESRNDISEMQWTQLSAELKAAETAPQLLNDLCERIKQLTAASQESEVSAPEEPRSTRGSPQLPMKKKEKQHKRKSLLFRQSASTGAAIFIEIVGIGC